MAATAATATSSIESRARSFLSLSAMSHRKSAASPRDIDLFGARRAPSRRFTSCLMSSGSGTRRDTDVGFGAFLSSPLDPPPASAAPLFFFFAIAARARGDPK